MGVVTIMVAMGDSVADVISGATNVTGGGVASDVIGNDVIGVVNDMGDDDVTSDDIGGVVNDVIGGVVSDVIGNDSDVGYFRSAEVVVMATDGKPV